MLHFSPHLANDCSRLGIKTFESVVFVEVEICFDAFVGFSKVPLHLDERTRTPARENEEQQKETFGHDRAAECSTICSKPE